MDSGQLGKHQTSFVVSFSLTHSHAKKFLNPKKMKNCPKNEQMKLACFSFQSGPIISKPFLIFSNWPRYPNIWETCQILAQY